MIYFHVLFLSITLVTETNENIRCFYNSKNKRFTNRKNDVKNVATILVILFVS